MAFYEPNQPYEYSNINGLPRQPIPQPKWSESSDKKNTVVFDGGVPFSSIDGKYGDHKFLAEISTCQPLEMENVSLSWEYHDKTSAQDILPFLYLGHMMAARNPAFIKSNGITMLFAVRDGKAAAVNPKIMDPARFVSAQAIETSTFDVNGEFDFAQRFRSAIKIMVDHLERKSINRPITQLNDVGGRILVFCEAGDRRSAVLIILFLMVVFGFTATDATQAVQIRRYAVTMTGELFRMLKSCEELLHAERQVAMDTHLGARHVNLPARSNTKRTADQVLMEDEDMQDIGDGNEMLRSGTAPFKDAGWSMT